MRTEHIFFDDHVASDAAQVGASRFKMVWNAVVAWFWRYTEETGKADTSSYDGLL